jgi:hypothetical protein
MASREHLQPHLDILQSILTDHPEADSGHDPTVRDSSPYDDKQIYENEHLLFRATRKPAPTSPAYAPLPAVDHLISDTPPSIRSPVSFSGSSLLYTFEVLMKFSPSS